MSIKSCRIGFGLSSIAGSGNFAHQQNLIRTAIDCGVTHFDVAPYYGSGDAEQILGKILSNCNEKVTITTKYGLAPLSLGKGGSTIRSTLRPIFRSVKALKSITSAIVNRLHDPKEILFEKAALFKSLDRSMHNLQRPIDFFLLHDANYLFADNPEVIECLDAIRKTGKMICTGISGTANVLHAMVKKYPNTYSIAQLENSLTCPAPIEELYDCGAKVITHRAIQGGSNQLNFLLGKRPGFKQILSRELDLDFSDKYIMPLLLIELALFENPAGTILFSTTNPDRIRKISNVLVCPILGKAGCIKLRRLFSDVYPLNSSNA